MNAPSHRNPVTRLTDIERRIRDEREGGHPCCHGHFGCACVEGGECQDELFSSLTDEERERYENGETA